MTGPTPLDPPRDTPDGARRYTVRRGDSLSTIAEACYGDARHWRALLDANRDQLDDPDRIAAGQVLRIPALPATTPPPP
ncbi:MULTISPECIES: LysM peptidoglycan-binding domain-containing protein [Luteimonas]|uniref:LysM peptidoglycan-binding domain-containing protein n=1 Tax=Luteimonas TaxID=83614 RepID=UPI000C7E6165|nr:MULTISPECIES: LysM peptidoglycan-binding domain-containing protein [Luteimonas]